MDIETEILNMEEKLSVENIIKVLGQVDIKLASNFLGQSSGNYDIVYLLGYTGSGKSTLINYLLN